MIAAYFPAWGWAGVEPGGNKNQIAKEPSMGPSNPGILTINGGSSSIKFALYSSDGLLKKRLYGKIDRIGLPGTSLTFNDLVQDLQGSLDISASDHRSAAHILNDWLEERIGFTSVQAAGHRVVHGMKYTEPELITQVLLDELHRISPFDPEHLPREVELIEAFRQHHPQLPQVACFDTAFHRAMPRVARLLPVPRRFEVMGVRRYGFHGLSYAYLMEELTRVAGAPAAQGRVILAHLGNGASLAAVHKGQSIDTSMGFTPASGIMMGTRTGDLDPGAAWFMMMTEKLTAKQFNNIINHESGLLGVSGTSSDMSDLLVLEAGDVRAAEAVALFCYQVKKWVGAFSAALGGLDILVFSGGIGENAPIVRARICDGLGFLGIELEAKRNMANSGLISAETSKIPVHIIHTDEELMIATTVRRVLSITS
jgi:acetate kinase